MVTSDGFTPRRAISIDNDLWAAYGEAVGEGGRSADLRAYITWRINNPTKPLPGQRLGPIKKTRGRRAPGDGA